MILIACNQLSAQNSSLNIKIENLSSTNGKVYFKLIKEGQEFGVESRGLVERIITLAEKKLEFQIDSLQNGNYAILVFHDENNNGELDTNFFGLPKEGVGNSTNYRGIPSFEKLCFTLVTKNFIVIEMSYGIFK